jgi:acetyl esterase/lipase
MPALPSPRKTITAIGAIAAVGLLCLGLAGSAAGATAVLDLDYDLGSPPPPSVANQGRLDLYLPEDATATDSRPIVVYVHGGAWRGGDKRNRIADKVNLFTGAGYVFASLNYRLSPASLSATPDPGRVKFPDHPSDIGEAIGWLDRNLASYGGDPERIALIGHSAGAHLVSLVATDPSYVEAYEVEPWQLIGAVSLDTAAFEVAARIAELGPVGRLLYLNAFGTAAENAATDSWAKASPITWADGGDPAQLLVTQAASPLRVQENRQMATALGQDPEGVFLAPYDHAGINDAVGDVDDPAGETGAIMAFLSEAIAAAQPPRAKLRKRPPKRIEAARRRAKVRFRFTSSDSGASFECRLDAAAFKPCRSPRRIGVGRGKHRFRVRAVAASGRPGPAVVHRFTVGRR